MATLKSEVKLRLLGPGGRGVGFLKIKRVLPILFNALIAEWSGDLI